MILEMLLAAGHMALALLLLCLLWLLVAAGGSALSSREGHGTR
jgi:hypothetical protein